MPNNPVQIILNHADFLQAPDPGSFGPGKDFFVNSDDAFIKHRDKLDKSVKAIKNELEKTQFKAGYLEVTMQEAALAKSYRPNQAIFSEESFPCVGASSVGTLYYRAPMVYLDRLIERIGKAEDHVETKISGNTGEAYKNPTRNRSEVGAIESIELTTQKSKRNFSTEEALNSLVLDSVASGYIIELFDGLDESQITDDILGQKSLHASLKELLLGLGDGARVYIENPIGRTPILEIQLTEGNQPAFLENRTGISSSARLSSSAPIFDQNSGRHEAVLKKLESHPLIRSIHMPLHLHVIDTAGSSAALGTHPLVSPVATNTYPKLGVIDSGVGASLGDWVVDRFDFLDDTDFDCKHGTNVAGIASVAFLSNKRDTIFEQGGCYIYDGALFPSNKITSHYKNGFSDFLEELEQCVIEAKQNHNIRIFNLSINASQPVMPDRYSYYAARLDEISDQHGVMFVNSVGNLSANHRTTWPKSPKAAISYFANRTLPDTIFTPSESVRSISVGSINPPQSSCLTGAPTTYTCRGPALQVGVKPDVAAYGGAMPDGAGGSTGLVSIDELGNKVEVMGTSFAAPIIARTLAELDYATQSGLTLEALRAMLIHHSNTPAVLKKNGLKELARQFTGFGEPTPVGSMLETDDHQITLVFQSRLTIGVSKTAILRFPFEWPDCLVDSSTGACRGRARLTLVCSPPLDPAFGAEFVRINLDAKLSQLQDKQLKNGRQSYKSMIKPKYLPSPSGLAVSERALINQGLKWWPTKQYETTFKHAGSKKSWRLEVDSLVRAESNFPTEGVPFAVVLTIEDVEKKAPVFASMQRNLQVTPTRAVDIRNALRLKT